MSNQERTRKKMRRHRIVLYNPQAVFYTMPLGPLAVASHLDSSRYDVTIIDGRLEADPVRAVLDATKDALLFGVSVLTGAPIRDALRVTRALKESRPDLPVVWGGWHASLFPTQTLAESSIDITVQGQGEVTFAEIVERLSQGGEPSIGRDFLEGIRGVAYRDNGTVVQSAPRSMTDMNDLSPHNYALIPTNRYFMLKGRRQLDYVSSTGCFWRCAFCADPFVFNRQFVAISPQRIGEEIEQLWRDYRFDELMFQDETFFTYQKRVIAIADEFLRRGCRFDWTATMRADQGARLSDSVFDELFRSGLRRVLIGVESGSQEMLDWMKKDITLEQVHYCAEQCERRGIGAIFPFIVGFPNEPHESVTATIELAKKLRAMSPLFETPIFYFKPYPGTDITSQIERDGYPLPQSLEEWASFDFVGSSGPWVSPTKFKRIERFKFYNRVAGGRPSVARWPVQQVARWRLNRDAYSLPVEMMAARYLRPAPRLS